MNTDKLDKKTSTLGEIYNELNITTLVEVFFVIVLIVLFLKSFVIEFYKVESGSMEPELYKNDIVAVSRIAYFFGIPTRFSPFGISSNIDFKLNYRSPKVDDIVVIDAKEIKQSLDDNFIIKRIKAIPGDTVFIYNSRFSNIYCTINSLNLIPNFFFIIPAEGDIVEISSQNLTHYMQILLNEGDNGQELINAITLNPKNIVKYQFQNSYYFIQGDNELNSIDSRSYSVIPEISIIGRAVILLNSQKQDKFLSIIK
jgi:signal peptidase I